MTNPSFERLLFHIVHAFSGRPTTPRIKNLQIPISWGGSAPPDPPKSRPPASLASGLFAGDSPSKWVGWGGGAGGITLVKGGV